MRTLWGFILVASVMGSVGLHAQVDGVLQGMVVDDSKGALPGVSVTATEVATGRRYTGTTDARGEFRLGSVAAGTYRVEAELSGFATVVIPNFELLVGQNATLATITMGVATINETISVTAAAPLVDTASARVGTNIDRRQLETLPLQGRNWLELALLGRGVTANSADNEPGVRDRHFSLNVDGQQITQNRLTAAVAQPRFSREAIAEFQMSTNQFDVTQGRTLGATVQAISRAGTNNLSGAVYGYFRDDALNAADPIVNTLVPYSNRQIGGALGGPIKRDKLLYFVTYEYEKEPQTVILTSSFPAGRVYQFPADVTQHMAMIRVDHNLSEKDHVTYRSSYWARGTPLNSSGSQPSSADRQNIDSRGVIGAWTRILSDAMVQEVRVGFDQFAVLHRAAFPAVANTPTYSFPGFSVGGPRPQFAPQNTISARYDLTWHRGSQDFKMGFEHLRSSGHGGYTGSPRGQFTFNTRPSDAELERRFPYDAYADPSRWDLSGLDSNLRSYSNDMGSNALDYDRPIFAAWIGDTWRATNRLTVNFGLRWDLDTGVANSGIESDDQFAPFGGPLYSGGVVDYKAIAPRGGFVYDLTGSQDFVIRGGVGMYYNFTTVQANTEEQRFIMSKSTTFLNDGLPGFLQNPTRNYTADEIARGLAPEQRQVLAHDFTTPYSVQSSIGFQKQLGGMTGVEMDLTHTKGFNALRGYDINLFPDPVTGYNLDPIIPGRAQQNRPDPTYTGVVWMDNSGATENLLLSAALNRRFNGNFQGAVSYTLTFRDHDNYNNVFGSATANNQFDLDDEWAYSTGFQRHTLRLNGMLNLPWNVSLAGIFAYGSGSHYATTVTNQVGIPYNKPGVNRLNIGPPIAIREVARERFRGPDVIGTGETTPRNALQGFSIQKLDLRLTKIFNLGGDLRLSGIAEVFNLFNHKNYGAYSGNLNAANFGDPVQNPSNTYRSRTGQLAVRLQF